MGRPACTMTLSHFGMPASRVTSVPISSMRAPRPSAMREQNLPRSSGDVAAHAGKAAAAALAARSEEHTSELQSLMRISYAVFCLKKKKTHTNKQRNVHYLEYG